MVCCRGGAERPLHGLDEVGGFGLASVIEADDRDAVLDRDGLQECGAFIVGLEEVPVVAAVGAGPRGDADQHQPGIGVLLEPADQLLDAPFV